MVVEGSSSVVLLGVPFMLLVEVVLLGGGSCGSVGGSCGGYHVIYTNVGGLCTSMSESLPGSGSLAGTLSAAERIIRTIISMNCYSL